jgi:hypothetical protein
MVDMLNTATEVFRGQQEETELMLQPFFIFFLFFQRDQLEPGAHRVVLLGVGEAEGALPMYPGMQILKMP